MKLQGTMMNEKKIPKVYLLNNFMCISFLKSQKFIEMEYRFVIARHWEEVGVARKMVWILKNNMRFLMVIEMLCIVTVSTPEPHKETHHKCARCYHCGKLGKKSRQSFCVSLKVRVSQTSPVFQRLRIHLPVHGTWFDSWSGETPHAREQQSSCAVSTEP